MYSTHQTPWIDKPWLSVILMLIAGCLSFQYQRSIGLLDGLGVAAERLQFIPIIIMGLGILVYLITRLSTARLNWIVTLTTVALLLYYLFSGWQNV